VYVFAGNDVCLHPQAAGGGGALLTETCILHCATVATGMLREWGRGWGWVQVAAHLNKQCGSCSFAACKWGWIPQYKEFKGAYGSY